MSSQDFAGKVVWITGATAGIGRALALDFASRGATVAVSGRREDRIREVVAELEAKGTRALGVPCDVTDEEQVAAAVQRVVKELGQLDVAVANAGFGVVGRIEKLDAAAWRRQLDTNVVGVAMTARYALAPLRATKGRFVVVSSVSGMLATPGSAAYSASKYGARAIGQTLSQETHGTGVTCTTIYPGFVESDISRVDNSGVFDASRRDSRPQKVMWKTDRAARVMVDAILARKREFTFTGHGKLGGFIGRHAPGLAHFVLTRGASRIPKSDKAPG